MPSLGEEVKGPLGCRLNAQLYRGSDVSLWGTSSMLSMLLSRVFLFVALVVPVSQPDLQRGNCYGCLG